MRLAKLVADCLMEGDFASYFASVPSALDCEQPVVLREGRFERDDRMDDEERGHVVVAVLVVRETAVAAEADAIACERLVRSCGWEAHAENGAWRVCGLDTTAPVFKERDGSGRFVWEFDVTLTVVRTVA
jgi:hypothetical protein